LAGFFELIRKYRKSRGFEKLQLKYLIVGIVETFGLQILTNFIAVVVFHYSGFVIFGPIFSLILVGFITYAIIRHRLLEVRVIVARSALYALLVLLVAGLYTFGIFFISQYFFKLNLNTQQVISYAILALFVAFTFVPLRNFIEKSTNRIFYKGRYDQHELVYQLTKIIASTITLEDVTLKTLYKLLLTLRISHGAFVIYSGRKFKTFSLGHNFYEDKKRGIDALYNLKRLTVFDEEKTGRTKEIMHTLDVSIAVPLFERGKKIGMLLLGEKKTGQIYSNRDIGILQIFGPAISVAIQNAQAYEEIKNFNSRLKKEVQHATKSLRDANIKLRELGKQKDEFMAIASHELKTPVTSIKLYTQLLHHKFVKARDIKSAESVTKMDMQVNKLVSLINDLLDATKIEEGKIKFNLELCDLNVIAKEVIEEMQLTTKHKIEMIPGKIGEVNADQNRISQVLVNFISNAIKYSPDANRVIVKTTGDKNNATVSVTDFGMGLTPEEQKKVFERFNRAGQEGPGGLPGLGLGLYISREIVRRHKGKIWVESKKRKGSTFYFSLPVLTKSSKN
jgi:signal transduction histidine kinase